MPFRRLISDNNNTYVGLTSTTLSRRLTMHLSDTSSMAQNNKQKLQILEALHIRNMQATLNRINFQ